MKYLILVLGMMLSGCSGFPLLKGPSSSQNEAVVALAKKAAEEAEYKNAEKVLAAGQFEDAQILFRDFHGRHSGSRFYQSARLGEAQALEGLEKYREAADLYRDIYLHTVQDQPNIAAVALYRMSFAYEALGEDQRTIAALLDARKLGTHLPVEVVEAEIPARLAAIYARHGRESEAVKYLNQAEKGIAQVIQEKGPDIKPSWLAKTYYQMGEISTNQLSVENFANFTEGQRWVQVYLFRAMRQGDSVWSKRAQKKLEDVYHELYRLFASANNREIRNRMGGELLDLIEQAELYKPVKEQSDTSYEREFFAYLAEVRKKLDGLLYRSGEAMSLTEESQQLNSIKRAGRVKVDAFLPEEEKSPIPLPPKVVPTEDPNL